MLQKRLIGFFLLLLPCLLYSAGTSFLKINTYQEFNKGDLINVILNEDGILSLSPKLNKILEMDTLFIWDIQEDSKGNIYLATGNEGIIYKINKENKLSRFFQTDSLAGLKMLIDADNNLYIATLTKGLIYKVTPEGKGDIFYVFKDNFIWDIKFYQNSILVATGSPGSIFRLDLKTKESREFIKTKEMHITSLYIEQGKDIYFGTSENGSIYKYSSGKLKLIYQSSENEIHSLLVHNGIIYAGTSDVDAKYSKVEEKAKDPKEGQSNKAEEKNVFDDLKELKKIQPIVNKVYEIKEDQSVARVIESKDTTFLSLLSCKGDIYIGTGDKGILYRYRNKKIEKMIELDEQQILCLYKRHNGHLLLSTGNTGNLYDLGLIYSDQGIYYSDIYDLGNWALWGKIQWSCNTPDETQVQVQTRTGNTEEIDDTWSEWSESYASKNNSQITSPLARFIQFRILLSTKNPEKTPEVYSLEIPYLIKNRKPELKTIKLSQNGKKNDKAQETGKAEYKKNEGQNYTLQINWEALDPDKDKLNFTIHAKEKQFANWVLLKKDLDLNSFQFDSRVLPDGEYTFKVTATDSPSNDPLTSLTDEIISKMYIIDNTPPVIQMEYKKTSEDHYFIYGTIADKYSKIYEINYSADAKKWENLFPIDQIFDAKEENFGFTYIYKTGIIMLKAEDEAGNINTQYLYIK